MALVSIATASKYLDDAFVSNKRYAEIGGVATSSFNNLEIAMLTHLNFGLSCSVGDFRKQAMDVLSGSLTAAPSSAVIEKEKKEMPLAASKWSPPVSRAAAGKPTSTELNLQGTSIVGYNRESQGLSASRSRYGEQDTHKPSASIAIRTAEEAPYRDTDTRGRSNSFGHTPPTNGCFVSV